jgi:hypothetical protein
VSGSLVTLLVVGSILGIAIGVAVAWVNARVRVNRPPSLREKIAVMVPLIVALLVFWYLCFTLDLGEETEKPATPGVNVGNFTTLYDDIVSADRSVNITAETLLGRPDDLTLETKLIGQKHYCLGLVSEYNARAKSFSQRELTAVNMPREIDQAAPETDCEERGSGRQR